MAGIVKGRLLAVIEVITTIEGISTAAATAVANAISHVTASIVTADAGMTTATDVRAVIETDAILMTVVTIADIETGAMTVTAKIEKIVATKKTTIMMAMTLLQVMKWTMTTRVDRTDGVGLPTTIWPNSTLSHASGNTAQW